MCLIRDLPVLRLTYLIIGSLVRGAREFWVKPSTDIDSRGHGEKDTWDH